jgi:uncharacterized protein DUF2752
MEIALFPRWIFRGIEEGRRRHLNYCVSAVVLVIAFPYLRLIPHVCLFRWILGVPCPGCGITTALAALCGFDFRGTVHANIAALPIALLLGFQILVRPFAIWSSSSNVGASIDRCSRFINFCASFSLCVVWITKLSRL